MKVHISAVWPFHRPDKTLEYADVIVRGERGLRYRLKTSDPFMASLCRQYEKPSSTLDPEASPVDLTWDADGVILDLTEAT